MTKKEHKAERIDLKALVGGDRDFLRELIRTTLQEVLEAEMTEALGAAKSERTTGRNGYRSGYYGRSLITRVGKLELRVPQDRTGQFSTELFERYQRSERALVAALAEMSYKESRPARSRPLPKSYAGIAFRRPPSARSTNAWSRVWPNSQRGLCAKPFPT